MSVEEKTHDEKGNSATGDHPFIGCALRNAVQRVQKKKRPHRINREMGRPAEEPAGTLMPKYRRRHRQVSYFHTQQWGRNVLYGDGAQRQSFNRTGATDDLPGASGYGHRAECVSGLCGIDLRHHREQRDGHRVLSFSRQPVRAVAVLSDAGCGFFRKPLDRSHGVWYTPIIQDKDCDEDGSTV